MLQHVWWINFTSLRTDWGRSLQAQRRDGSTYGQLSMRPSDRWCNHHFNGNEWCSFSYKSCIALESLSFDFSTFISVSSWNFSSNKPFVQQKFMFLFSYFHYRTCDRLVGVMSMPRERRRRVPGSSTDKSKIFTFATKHPDQYIQCVWREVGIFLQGKCLGY